MTKDRDVEQKSFLYCNSSLLVVAFRVCMRKSEMDCVIKCEDTILLRTGFRIKIRNFSTASLSLVIPDPIIYGKIEINFNKISPQYCS
jgi:hypothetical protein